MTFGHKSEIKIKLNCISHKNAIIIDGGTRTKSSLSTSSMFKENPDYGRVPEDPDNKGPTEDAQ